MTTAEYAPWVGVSLLGTAGSKSKHAFLRGLGVARSASSRDAAAFACGARGHAHACVNSLSADFVPLSAARLVERGAFEELGKRSVWSEERWGAAAPAVEVAVLAIDASTAADPAWMRRVLTLLSARVEAGVCRALPLLPFSLEGRAEAAFRVLLSGSNVGKVVVFVPRPSDEACRDLIGGGR